MLLAVKYSCPRMASSFQHNNIPGEIFLVPVVQKVDRAIPWINQYPVDNAISFRNTYPMDTKQFIRWIALSNFWTTGVKCTCLGFSQFDVKALNLYCVSAPFTQWTCRLMVFFFFLSFFFHILHDEQFEVDKVSN